MHTTLTAWLSERVSVSGALKNACDFISIHDTTFTQAIHMANTIIEWGCDDALIVAAILYPTLSSHPALLDKAAEDTDKSVIKMIHGAKQMEIIHQAGQGQAEALRKMMLAMVDDIRTVLLKLAERLFLITHLDATPKEMQKQIAQDTMDYYAPLANRLGITKLKLKLEDGAFRYLYPEEFKTIRNAFESRKADRKRIIQEMIHTLKKTLADNGLVDCEFSGRVKHLYSIYKKIKRKKVSIDHIYDASAIRIVVPSLPDCYAALSLVHEKWQPIPEEFDDYIAKPKANGYQSIHTAVLRNDNTPIEIQIRTKAMHDNSEQGFAAHWKYKESLRVTHNDSESQKIQLLRELLDWQKKTLSHEADKAQLYRDAFHDRVYVFSKAGDVFDLEKGATPLDFAYLVHTTIGHRCRGAKVNGALVPLSYTLQTGDHIDILTAKEIHPSHDWIRPELGYLKTAHAIRKVKLFYRKQDFDKNVTDGAALWEKACHQHGFQKTDLQKVLEGFHLQNTDAVLAALGAGDITLSAIVQKLALLHKAKSADETILAELKKTPEPAASLADFSVQGATHLLTQLAHCCHPIPGDNVVGYITVGRGISVHQRACHNIKKMLKNVPERLIEITWEDTKAKSYRVTVMINSEDRPGLLRDITALFAQLNVSISAIRSHHYADHTIGIDITIDVSGLDFLESVIKKTRQIQGVIKVLRG